MQGKLEKFSHTCTASEELRYLHQNDRCTDACNKTAHHRRGYIIDKLSGFHIRKGKQPECYKQRQNRNCPHRLFGTALNSHRKQCGSDKCCRRCIHTENKLRRGGKDRKKQDRQYRTIQPIDCRKSRNLRISHGDRYGNRHDDQSRQNIFSQIFFLIISKGWK